MTFDKGHFYQRCSSTFYQPTKESRVALKCCAFTTTPPPFSYHVITYPYCSWGQGVASTQAPNTCKLHVQARTPHTPRAHAGSVYRRGPHAGPEHAQAVGTCRACGPQSRWFTSRSHDEGRDTRTFPVCPTPRAPAKHGGRWGDRNRVARALHDALKTGPSRWAGGSTGAPAHDGEDAACVHSGCHSVPPRGT